MVRVDAAWDSTQVTGFKLCCNIVYDVLVVLLARHDPMTKVLDAVDLDLDVTASIGLQR